MKRNLQELSNQTFDVLVIGGGIHGAVTAWDAALRGLKVVLIERGDFGSATSQNSLKIIHGGLRYLREGNLPRIRTMARERTTWMKIASHLVHPLTCLTPTRHKLSHSRQVLSAALTLNDLLSFDRNRLADPEKNLPSGKIISRRELARLLPGYDVGTSTGAAIWYDGQIYNSERLLLEFILSAVEAGAEVANYVEAIGFLQRGDRIMGVRAKEVLSGQVLDVQSKLVINCAGAWIDKILEKVTVQSEYATSVAMNLIVEQVWPGIAAGLPSRPTKAKHPQILFIVPWRNKSMIGTWHIPWNDAPDAFKLNNAVVQEFIDEVNTAYPSLGLSLADIQHVTWGFLPVHKKSAHKVPVKLTRDGVVIDHQKKDNLAGLISVLGVKYTTARVVAEKTVDLAVEKLALKTAKCQTRITTVKGGQIDDFKTFLKMALANKPRGMDADMIKHLVYTYGSDYLQLVKCLEAQPDLAQRIDPILPVTGVEVIHAVHDEMALTLVDVIQRRTELGSTGLPSMPVLRKCAGLMGKELRWNAKRQEEEIAAVIRAYPFRQTVGAIA